MLLASRSTARWRSTTRGVPRLGFAGAASSEAAEPLWCWSPEKRGQTSGRIRMAVIPDFKATTLGGFIKEHVTPGSTIYTDGLKTFAGLEEAGYQHVPRTQPHRVDLRKGAKSVVPLADRAIGNLQQWLVGTHHGVSRPAAGVPGRVRVSAQPPEAAIGCLPNLARPRSQHMVAC